VAIVIATVVEGHGEVEAVPVLLRRIAADVAPDLYINVPRPYRVGRHALVRPGGLEDVVRTQGDRVASGGGVLVLIDADDDCPAELAPQLLDRALAARRDRRIALVLVNREYEAASDVDSRTRLRRLAHTREYLAMHPLSLEDALR
jgi:hypothetical protein